MEPRVATVSGPDTREAPACWPDGSVIDKWFSQKEKQVRKCEQKRFSILDFGAVPDSTVL